MRSDKGKDDAWDFVSGHRKAAVEPHGSDGDNGAVGLFFKPTQGRSTMEKTGELVLGRTLNESILIAKGDELIIVTVRKITGKQARIGIKAPQDWTILRDELIQESDHGNQLHDPHRNSSRHSGDRVD